MNALSIVNRVPAQMRMVCTDVLSACHTASAALNSYRSRSDEDSRFSAPVLIALGILSSLMMAFPLLLKRYFTRLDPDEGRYCVNLPPAALNLHRRV